MFRNVPLWFGITIIIHSRINDPCQCWYIHLFCDIICYHLILLPPNPSAWEYKTDLRCCLCWQFPWHSVRSVCQGRDGRRSFCQKCRIGSLLIVFAWRVWTVLFGVIDWRLRCGPVTSTRTTLFKMHPLLMLWCYIMLCQQILKQKLLIYNL